MKDMELIIQEQASAVQTLKSQLSEKDSAIAKLEKDNESLSEDRRKEMEQMLETFDDWLNSLKGISDDVRAQFKCGLSKVAKAATKNEAWEVICNASHTHKENVAKIEELVKACNEKEKTIQSLLNNSADFRHTSSRITTAETESEGCIPPPSKKHKPEDSTSKGDAWDYFSQLMVESGKQTYF